VVRVAVDLRVAGRRVGLGVMPSLSPASGVIGVPHVGPEVSPADVGSVPSSRRCSLVELGPSVMRSPLTKLSKVLSPAYAVSNADAPVSERHRLDPARRNPPSRLPA
jgi:hypothetical protein